eukprot:scaffold1254_cov251-Pinguiococcus_pyrenoidosus.AAC.4
MLPSVEQARREIQGVHGTSHQVEPSQESGEEIGEEQRQGERADEALPGLIRTEGRQERLLHEALPQRHSAEVREGIVRNHGRRRHHEPEEPIVDVADRPLQLGDNQHDAGDAPAEVADLIPNQLPLEIGNRADEHHREEDEGPDAVVLHDRHQPVEAGLREGEVPQPLAIRVENRHREPGPLRRSEQRDLQLARGVVADIHQLQVEGTLHHQHHSGNIEVSSRHHHQEKADHREAKQRSPADLCPLLLSPGRLLRRQRSDARLPAHLLLRCLHHKSRSAENYVR